MRPLSAAFPDRPRAPSEDHRDTPTRTPALRNGRRPLPALVVAAILCGLSVLAPLPAASQTPDEWIAYGARVHGGFGSYIALGIRIGVDALEVLGADRRQVDVTLWDGVGSPCACVVDGVLVATSASPGQRTLRVAEDPAPEGLFARVLVRHRTDGRAVVYDVPWEAREFLDPLNQAEGPEGRLREVLAVDADRLFSRRMESAPD